jgi:uncharacterized protein (TIGR02217 family)
MASFTETQFPPEISQGSSGGPSFSTDIIATVSGFEERSGNWSEERNSFEALHENLNQEDFEAILIFFKAMRGKLYGFRFKDWGDYKSCGINSAIAFDDQIIGSGDGSTVAFQVVKKYTNGFTYQRDIKKPVSGSVLAGIGGKQSTTNFAVDTSTGVVTFDNITKTITGAVSSAGNTVITAAIHGLIAGDSVYLSSFTGSWAGLNAARYTVTAAATNTFTIVFNSSAYTAYSSNAGQLKTAPQTGESVTAGFEFDVPARFDTNDMISSWVNFQSFGFSLPIIEIKL